jgi:hypothetical protein
MPLPPPVSSILGSDSWKTLDEEQKEKVVDQYRKDTYSGLVQALADSRNGYSASDFIKIENEVISKLDPKYKDFSKIDAWMAGARQLADVPDVINMRQQERMIQDMEETLPRFTESGAENKRQTEEFIAKSKEALNDKRESFLNNMLVEQKKELEKGQTRAQKIWDALPPEMSVLNGFLASKEGAKFIGETIVGNAPQSIAQIAATAGFGPVAGGAAGMALEYSGTVMDRVRKYAVDNKMDPEDPGVLASIMQNKEVMQDIDRRAGIKSAVIGVFDAATGKIGGMIAKKMAQASIKPVRSAISGAVAGAAIDIPSEGLGEFGSGMIAFGESDIKDVYSESLAGIGPAAGGAIRAGYSDARSNREAYQALAAGKVTPQRAGKVTSFGVNDPLDPGQNFLGQKFGLSDQGSSIAFDEIESLGLNPRNLTDFAKRQLASQFERVIIRPDGSVFTAPIVDSGPSYGSKAVDLLPATIERIGGKNIRQDGKIVGVEGVDEVQTFIARKGKYKDAITQPQAEPQAEQQAQEPQLAREPETTSQTSPQAEQQQADEFQLNETDAEEARKAKQIASLYRDLLANQLKADKKGKKGQDVNIRTSNNWKSAIESAKAIIEKVNKGEDVSADLKALESKAKRVSSRLVKDGVVRSYKDRLGDLAEQAQEKQEKETQEQVEEISGAVKNIQETQQKAQEEAKATREELIKAAKTQEPIRDKTLSERNAIIKNLTDESGKRVDEDIDRITREILDRRTVDPNINFDQEIADINEQISGTSDIEAQDSLRDRLSDIILLDSVTASRAAAIGATREQYLKSLIDQRRSLLGLAAKPQRISTPVTNKSLEGLEVERASPFQFSTKEKQILRKSISDNLVAMQNAFGTDAPLSTSEVQGIANEIEYSIYRHIPDTDPADFQKLLQIPALADHLNEKPGLPPAALPSRETITSQIKASFPEKSESWVRRAVNAVIEFLQKVKDFFTYTNKNNQAGAIFPEGNEGKQPTSGVDQREQVVKYLEDNAPQDVKDHLNEQGSTIIFGEIADAIISGAKTAGELVARLAARGYQISKDIAQKILDLVTGADFINNKEAGAVLNPFQPNSPTAPAWNKHETPEVDPKIVPELPNKEQLLEIANTKYGFSNSWTFRGLDVVSELLKKQGGITKLGGSAISFSLRRLSGQTLGNMQDQSWMGMFMREAMLDIGMSNAIIFREKLQPALEKARKHLGWNDQSRTLELVKVMNPDKSSATSDVLEAYQKNPASYHLNEDQKNTIEQLIEVQKELTDLSIRLGANIDPKTGDILYNINTPFATRGYAVLPNGKLANEQLEAKLAKQNNKRLRSAKRTFFQKAREFETEQDGIDSGVIYQNPIERLVEYYEELIKSTAERTFIEVAAMGTNAHGQNPGVTEADIRASAEQDVDDQIAEGRILPKDRDTAIEKLVEDEKDARVVTKSVNPGMDYYIPAELADRIVQHHKRFKEPGQFRRYMNAIRSSSSIKFLSDLGHFGLQLPGLAGPNVKVWSKSVKSGLVGFWSTKDAAIKEAMKSPELQEAMEILAKGGYRFGQYVEDLRPDELKNFSTDRITKAQRGFETFKRKAGLHRFETAFSSTLDMAAIMRAAGELTVARIKGVDINSPKFQRQLAVGLMRGGGKGNSISKSSFTDMSDFQAFTETIALFAPGYYRAGVETFSVALHPDTDGRLARQTLFNSFSVGAILTIAGVMANAVTQALKNGDDLDEWEKYIDWDDLINRVFNPTSRDWLKVRTKGSDGLWYDVSYGNIHKPLLQVVSTLTDPNTSFTDNVVRFATSRKGLLLGAYSSLISPEGQFQTVGTGNAFHVAHTLLTPIMPVWLQDQIESSAFFQEFYGRPEAIVKEDQKRVTMKLKASEFAFNFFGFNQYTPSPRTQTRSDILDRAKSEYGTEYKNLTPGQRVKLSTEAMASEKEEYGTERFGSFSEAFIEHKTEQLDNDAKEFYSAQLGVTDKLVFPSKPKVYDLTEKGNEHLLASDEYKKAAKLFAHHLNDIAFNLKYKIPDGVTKEDLIREIIKVAKIRTIRGLGYKAEP